MSGHLSSQEHHDPLGIHHATNPRSSMTHMSGLQGDYHPMVRSMVLLICLCPTATLATGWMWLGGGLLGKSSQTSKGQRAMVGHRVQSKAPAWQALGGGSRMATAVPLGRCPPFTGTVTVSAPFSVPPMT